MSRFCGANNLFLFLKLPSILSHPLYNCYLSVHSLAAICSNIGAFHGPTQHRTPAYHQDHGNMDAHHGSIKYKTNSINCIIQVICIQDVWFQYISNNPVNPSFFRNFPNLIASPFQSQRLGPTWPEIHPTFPEIPRAKVHSTQHRRKFASSTSLNLDLPTGQPVETQNYTGKKQETHGPWMGMSATKII